MATHGLGGLNDEQRQILERAVEHKLAEMTSYRDTEFPEFITTLVKNNRDKETFVEMLSDLLDDLTRPFVDWLEEAIQQLKAGTFVPPASPEPEPEPATEHAAVTEDTPDQPTQSDEPHRRSPSPARRERGERSEPQHEHRRSQRDRSRERWDDRDRDRRRRPARRFEDRERGHRYDDDTRRRRYTPERRRYSPDHGRNGRRRAERESPEERGRGLRSRLSTVVVRPERSSRTEVVQRNKESFRNARLASSAFEAAAESTTSQRATRDPFAVDKPRSSRLAGRLGDTGAGRRGRERERSPLRGRRHRDSSIESMDERAAPRHRRRAIDRGRAGGGARMFQQAAADSVTSSRRSARHPSHSPPPAAALEEDEFIEGDEVLSGDEDVAPQPQPQHQRRQQQLQPPPPQPHQHQHEHQHQHQPAGPRPNAFQRLGGRAQPSPAAGRGSVFDRLSSRAAPVAGPVAAAPGFVGRPPLPTAAAASAGTQQAMMAGQILQSAVMGGRPPAPLPHASQSQLSSQQPPAGGFRPKHKPFRPKAPGKPPAAVRNMAQTLCKFFPNCLNKKCGFFHPVKCKFNDKCTRRATCPFWHSDQPIPGSSAPQQQTQQQQQPQKGAQQQQQKGAQQHVSSRKFASEAVEEHVPLPKEAARNLSPS